MTPEELEELRRWLAVEVIPPGYCQCGCGQQVEAIKETDNRRGWIKGKYKQFIRGHNMKGDNHPKWNNRETINHRGKKMVSCPTHRRANKSGYVFEHILKAEDALGKSLPDNVIVHHHTPSQLVVCENQGYHMLLHQRTNAFKACSNVHWRKCVYCQIYDDPNNLYVHPKGNPVFHLKCLSEYRQNRKAICLAAKAAKGE